MEGGVYGAMDLVSVGECVVGGEKGVGAEGDLKTLRTPYDQGGWLNTYMEFTNFSGVARQVLKG